MEDLSGTYSLKTCTHPKLIIYKLRDLYSVCVYCSYVTETSLILLPAV